MAHGWQDEIYREECARCESILMSRAASEDIQLAKKIAFDTHLTADEGISLLNKSQSPGLSADEYIYKQEVRRITSILQSDAGVNNIDLAKHVALNTSMETGEAIAFVKQSAAAKRKNLFETAMSFIPNPDVSAGGEDDNDGVRMAYQLSKLMNGGV